MRARQACSGLIASALLSLLSMCCLPARSAAGPGQDGAWTDTASTACTAINVAVLRGGGDSTRVIYWGDERDFVNNAFQTTARAWRFAPGAAFSLSNCYSVPVGPEVFCGGQASLPDGRLLVAGGQYNLFTGIDDAHVFSPSQNRWTWQPNMVEPRWYPTVTPLADGRMLVTSGEKYSSLEIFGGAGVGATLPDTLLQFAILDTVRWGRYLPGTRPAPRTNHTSCYDPLRKLNIIFGGETAGGVSSEVWVSERTDNSTGPSDHTFVWSAVTQIADPVAGLPAARSLHSAVFAADGSNSAEDMVLVFGGRAAGGAALGDLWALKVRAAGSGFTGQWTRLDPAVPGPAPRFGHSAVYYDFFGKMIVFGGCLGATFSDSSWVLDVHTLEWLGGRAAVGPKARFRHAAMLTGDPSAVSRLMMVAGGSDADSCMSTVWTTLVGPAPTFSWTERNVLPSPRRGLSLCYDPLGPAIAFGGESFAGTPLNDASVMYISSFAGWFTLAQATRVAPRAGHTATYNPRYVQARVPSLYAPSTTGPGSWSDLTSAARILATYPFMFAAPNGKVFMAGPDADTRYLDVAAGTWGAPINAAGGAGSAVMYAPGKILRAANHSPVSTSYAEYIDLSATTPAWASAPGMLPRAEANLTVLPTGEVLVTGGKAPGGADQLRPQRWKPGVGWGPPLAPEPILRGYHSTAALLPDGRILSAGGSTEGAGGPADIGKRTACIYSPPYLFKPDGTPATRPVLNSAPAELAYGQNLTLCATTNAVSAVALVRPSAVTHAFNQEQRYVPLSFVAATNPNRLLVAAPANSDLAPPGNYLLFVVGQDSVPAIARWVRLSGNPGVDSCDTVAPGGVTDLSGAVFCTRIVLSWTAPADDGALAASGAAKSYSLRWWPRSTISNPDTFLIANPIPLPAPSAPGTTESYEDVVGACSGKRYYAIRATDDAPTANAGPVGAMAGYRATPCPPPGCEDDPPSLVSRLPAVLEIARAQPNPVASEFGVLLRFPEGAVGSRYRLDLFDLSGRLVRELDSGVVPEGGTSTSQVQLRSGSGLRAGVYFLRLAASGQQSRRRLILLP